MSKVVIINGYPATGKSTLVAQLRARNVRCPVISKDEIKEKLFDSFAMTNQSHGRQLNEAALSILFNLLQEHLRSDSDVIIEGNFKPRFDQKQVEALFNQFLGKVFQIMLTCSAEVSEQRDESRHNDGSRHSGHSKMDNAALNRQQDEVRFFNLKKSVNITVDTSSLSLNGYQKIADDVIRFLAQ